MCISVCISSLSPHENTWPCRGEGICISVCISSLSPHEDTQSPTEDTWPCEGRRDRRVQVMNALQVMNDKRRLGRSSEQKHPERGKGVCVLASVCVLSPQESTWPCKTWGRAIAQGGPPQTRAP